MFLQDDDDDDDEEDDDDDDEEQEQRADDATAGTGEGDWAVKDLDAESVDSEVRHSFPHSYLVTHVAHTQPLNAPRAHSFHTLLPHAPPPTCLDHTRAQALRRAQGDKDALELAAKLLVQRRVRVPRSHFPRHHRSPPLIPPMHACTAA